MDINSATAAAKLIASSIVGKDSDGDNDGSKGSSVKGAGGSGPAVVLSLTNTVKGDMAAGDPDHDGH